MLNIKNKHRNIVDPVLQMVISLPNTEPNIKRIVASKGSQMNAMTIILKWLFKKLYLYLSKTYCNNLNKINQKNKTASLHRNYILQLTLSFECLIYFVVKKNAK